MSVSAFHLMWQKKEGLEIQIETGELENTHPNTAEITLTAADGEKVSLRGSSIGRGEYPDIPSGMEWRLLLLGRIQL